MKITKIFSRRVATTLISKGNNLIRTEENLKKRNFLVFIFEDTEKLREDLSEISNN